MDILESFIFLLDLQTLQHAVLIKILNSVIRVSDTSLKDLNFFSYHLFLLMVYGTEYLLLI